ncbi:MAG: calcium/sodium antiporter [Betaproteobacteria bacterium]|nr:calcium/sodium antiporter [Rhodocyclaceae bacterium]MCA3141424.1 calcium/sodium antiporter [Rhodocyclaceae bacterium]
MTLLLFALGLALLVAGAELLVRGASRLAGALGIPPLVIGLTVVAFGTSAPEMAVSVQAAASGETAIAMGNVVGSNIFNVLLILGLAALITPLVVHQQLVRLDVPVMIAAAFLLAFMARDGRLSLPEGAVLLASLAAYTALQVRLALRERDARVVAEYQGAVGREGARVNGGWPWQVLLVAAGLVLLVMGSRLLVQSAVTLAGWLGISETVVGLTIVAAGTSLPEVAASVMASIRGERDIAVGNVVGSNVFNILGVLGLSALVSGQGLPVPASVLAFDLPVMLAVAVACLPIFFTGWSIARWEGAVFLGYYVAYTAFLVLDASGYDALPRYSQVMLWFVMPLTALTLLVVTARSLRGARAGAGGPRHD